MNETDKIILSEQTKFRLSEIIGTENYFNQEISQRKSCSKKFNKYVTASDYIDQALIVLSTITGRVSIISFTIIVGAAVGIVSASFILIFSLTTGIVKKTTGYNKKQKEKAW